MQTFLPHPDYDVTARCLDRQRLGKQRVEVLQILRTLRGESAGWANHPAVRMWRGHVVSLALYGVAVCREWRRRGYVDNTSAKMELYLIDGRGDPPAWLGDERLHASHRSNLLRKDPVHYGQFGWAEPSDLPYFWPSQQGGL